MAIDGAGLDFSFCCLMTLSSGCTSVPCGQLKDDGLFVYGSVRM